MPNGVNSVLYNIVDAYNKVEVERAKKEHRKAELLPKFSAHVMRHTACTRMAECRMDVKVLQYIMGHANIDVTMEVYNHIGELTRIEKRLQDWIAWSCLRQDHAKSTAAWAGKPLLQKQYGKTNGR